MSDSGSRTYELIKEALRQGRGDAEAGVACREAAQVLDAIGASSDPDSERIYESYRRAFDSVSRRETLVDAASEMSFPASDPPSYMGGASVAGAPDPSTPTEKPNTKVSEPETVRPEPAESATR